MLNIELSIEWTEMPLELVIHGARNSCVVGIASVKEDGHDSATLLLPDPQQNEILEQAGSSSG
jgi:hypothetical protein